ncbi:MAG: hypothetical protein PF690_09535 [Deltaproteobacteria bacterium]|jgi:predicted metal-dependent enzyme (double-stranded beta helix superfamily)|nr:hypothetical protein [Deltaproteobacteria bacterium]
MSEKNSAPKTYLNHPNQWKLKALLEDLFTDPDPDHITEELKRFLQKYPIPIDDFPLTEGTYSRTILFRSNNGYEAMAARWSPGAISSIHGHPHFALIIVTKGGLGIDYFKKHDGRVEMTRSGFLSESQFFSDIGQAKTFDNHIHRVQAYEETLSIHISSDDAAKGETFG